MKILHVISSVDPRGGGPVEGVFASTEVWLRHGHERHILCLDPPDAPWVLKSPATTFAVGISGRYFGALRQTLPWLRYGYTPRLIPWLEAYGENYDAIIINGLWNYASYGTWRALQNARVRYFVFPHGMLDPWFNKAYPTKTFFKTIYWKLFEHKVLRDARGVLFTSADEREVAPRSFSPYCANEFVVGFGTHDVDGDAAAQRAAFATQVPELRGRKFILFLGRLHPKKGVDLLIEAFARQAAHFPAIDLVIAGPDQIGWRRELEKLARELGVAERIYWPGFLSGDAKWGAFRSAEFFTLPSHQENFGVAVAESLALGTPVLISDKVNIWHEIEADEVGLVVNDDVQAISAGLKKMCALPPAERETMSAKCRASFLERYNIERNAMDLLDFLRDRR